MGKNEVLMDAGLHTLAVMQARSLAEQARRLNDDKGNKAQVHDILTFLVLSGLSIELYFKAIMLAGRGGRVTKGHELKKLYAQLPGFLKKSLSENFLFHQEDIKMDIPVIGIIQSADLPETPNKEKLDNKYICFESSIESVSNIFTRARYFFEEVNKKDYSYVEYPFGQIKALLAALEKTYNSLLNNEFKGRT